MCSYVRVCMCDGRSKTRKLGSCAEKREMKKGRRIKCHEEGEPLEEMRCTGREKECLRGWCCPNCMPDSDFHPLLFLHSLLPTTSRSSILLSSTSISSLSHLSGTSICEQPTPGGTPVRKRGIRNVIAPLREVSWYEEHSLVLLLRHFPFSSRPRARSISLPQIGRAHV